MKLAISLTLALATCAATSQHPWLEDAIHEAAAAHQPLVVEFHASWCQPCRVFEQRVLPDPRVQQALAGVRYVRYDEHSHVGQDAVQRCDVHSYPTWLGIDGQGRIRLKKVGAEPTAEAFLEFLAQTRRVLGSPDGPR